MPPARKHSKQKFVPSFNLEKHKPYAEAFHLILDNTCLDKYYNIFFSFLKDNQISPSNPEDITIFRHFVFDSDFGIINTSFVKNVIRNTCNLNSYLSIDILSKYISFIGKVSWLHQADVFDTLFRDYPDKILIETILKNLSAEDKVAFLEAGAHSPKIMEMFPKFKLYLLFS